MEPVLRRFDARDYLRILTKRKWFVIMVALAATIIGGLYTVSYPKTYRAASIVLIRRQGQPIIWVGENRNQGPQREDLALETQARIAASVDCADRAAKTLASRTSGDSIQVTGQEIASSITATPNEPDLLRIEAIHREQQFAIEFANEVARSFVETSRELRRTESRAAREFLEEALRRSKQSLDSAQADAARYSEQIGIILPEAEPKMAIDQLGDFEGQLEQTRVDIAAAQAEHGNLVRQINAVPAFKTQKHQQANPAREALLERQRAYQIELVELQARYTDNWPAVREMKGRIEKLQAELARQAETITTTSTQPDAEHGDVQHELLSNERRIANLQARQRVLTQTVASLKAQKQTYPERLANLQRLLDRVALNKTSYQNVLAQLENAKLNEAMKQADAELIDHAASASEISPKLGRMLIFSMTLGIACGIALAMFLEALDDTLHSPEDVSAYTPATFLGMVPLLEDPTQGLITVLSPKSPPAEAYRTLRSNVHFAQVDHPARTFLVTSAGAGEGKTMTTANLAAVFAQAGQEVLLVDTDLRRPSLHRIFGLSSDRGLTNVLVGETTLDEVIVDTDVPGLRLVPTGPLPPNPAELLESEQMDRIIARCRDVADVVFFDSPPAIVLTDAVIMSSKVERVILVAEAGQVTRDAFNEMCRLISNARGTILGVVLNKLRLSAGDYYYYYYYYDYSHYAPRRGANADMPITTGAPEGQVNNGFTSADAPSMLEEIFGPQNGLPSLPQSQPPAQPPIQMRPPAGPATGPDEAQPPLSPDLTIPYEVPSVVPPEDVVPEPPPPAEPPQTQRSPLEELFGPQDGNDN
ncbi:MAG: GumC family protein [Bacteroidota bacterium]